MLRLFGSEEAFLLAVNGDNSNVVLLGKGAVDFPLLVFSDYAHVARGLGCEHLHTADCRKQVPEGADHFPDLVRIFRNAAVDVVMNIETLLS